MQKPLSVSAVILAGGHSRRMGRDKASICWQGVPMLRRVYDVAADCVESVAVLTPWIDRYREILPESCQFLQETQPGQGPLVALLQVLERVSNEWLWLLACDLPRLQAPVLQTWIDRLAELPDDVLACVPRSESGWEPLCGFYRRRVRSRLEEFVRDRSNGDVQRLSFQQWLAEIPTDAIAVDAEIAGMLHNCNRLEDLQFD